MIEIGKGLHKLNALSRGIQFGVYIGPGQHHIQARKMRGWSFRPVTVTPKPSRSLKVEEQGIDVQRYMNPVSIERPMQLIIPP